MKNMRLDMLLQDSIPIVVDKAYILVLLLYRNCLCGSDFLASLTLQL